MAVEVKFGNLGIDELERDLGIKLTEADRKFFQETRQEQVMEGKEAVKMPTRAWHFFDIPRVLELGSYSFYLEIEELLSNYDIQGRLDVSFVFSDDEKVENLYELESIEGYPKYLYGHVISSYSYSSFHFWQIYKVNKRTIEYRSVRSECFFEDKKELERYVIDDFLVPRPDDYSGLHSVKLKKEELENFESEIITFAGYGDIFELKPWKGERVSRYGSSKKVDWEEYKKREKAYRKRVRNLGK